MTTTEGATERFWRGCSVTVEGSARQRVPQHGLDEQALISVRFAYSEHDPYVVALDIREPGCEDCHGEDPNIWEFARDVLAGHVVGLGDVDVRWVGGRVLIALSSWCEECEAPPSPSAHKVASELNLPGEEIATFLRCSFELVPYGGEGRYIDVAAEWAQLNQTNTSGSEP